MVKENLTYQMLTEKARKEKMTFSNLLGGVVVEEIVRRISASEYQENFWLRNGSILGKEQYEKKLILHLEYDYVIPKPGKSEEEKTDAAILSGMALELKKKVFEGVTEYGVKFSVKGKVFKKYVQLQIQAEIEGMQVPVTMDIYPLKDEKKIPRKECFTSILFPEVIVNYYSYPIEAFLAELYVEVITKLELIPNLKPYYDIYEMLEQESVDGRKVKEYIVEQCEKLQISKEKHRLDMIAGYQNYTYMKKKWKVFLRSINSKEPAWEQVVERFLKFFEPIWKAIAEDYVFFGDWMPELNRFL